MTSGPSRSILARWKLAVITLLLFVFCLITISAQDAKPAPTPTPSRSTLRERPSGSIEGSVTDDGGRPIVDARISVSGLNVDRNLKFESTDDEGRFHISNLSDGAYRVSVGAPSYVQSDINEIGPEGFTKLYHPGDVANFSLAKGGVITGTVTNQAGEPIVGLNVNVVRVGQAETDLDTVFGLARPTDDRGVYRIYGLRAGKYVVYTGGEVGGFNRSSPFEKDAPTYYPSSTRDTATILTVQAGQELADINIRYRGEPGFTISGTVTGSVGKMAILSLAASGSNSPVSATFSPEQDGRHSFSFTGIPNGDYKLVGVGGDNSAHPDSIGSLTVSVKNNDVTGVVVTLAPLGSVAGHVSLTETADAQCKTTDRPGLDRVVVALQPEKKQIVSPFLSKDDQTAPDQHGDFRMDGLLVGNYRLRALLPTDDWYIQSVSRAANKSQTTGQPEKTSPTSPESLSIKSGENTPGLAINLSTRAGSLSGQITTASSQNAQAISNLRLVLVPTEKERADDTLRYSEVPINSDGAFSFRNLAPGRYFLLSRVASEPENPARPLVWDSKERAKLLHDAETLGAPVEIKPCQATRDFKASISANGSVKPTNN